MKTRSSSWLSYIYVSEPVFRREMEANVAGGRGGIIELKSDSVQQLHGPLGDRETHAID